MGINKDIARKDYLVKGLRLGGSTRIANLKFKLLHFERIVQTGQYRPCFDWCVVLTGVAIE